MGTISTHENTCTAFAGTKMIASGDLRHVAQLTKKTIDGGEREFILIFDDMTAQPIEIDFRGTTKDVIARIDERDAQSPNHSANTCEKLQQKRRSITRTGTSEIGSGGTRGYALAPTLGLVEQPTGRRIRSTAETGRRRQTHKCRQRYDTPVSRSRLSLYVCHGGKFTRLRRIYASIVCR